MSEIVSLRKRGEKKVEVKVSWQEVEDLFVIKDEVGSVAGLEGKHRRRLAFCANTA